jgi:hypothetical protein
VGRVDDELAVDAADAHRADRAGEGDVGQAEGGGGAVHREHVGVVLTIGAEQDGDDLGVVEITLREERPQRAVGHAAGEDFLFGGAAFALEVTTGENAGGGGFFLVFHGEREPGLAGLHLGGGNGGDQDDGVTAADGDGTVGEFGKFAGFDRHRVGSDLDRSGMDVHFFFLFFFFQCGRARAAGLPGGHSVFSGQNPRPKNSGAADGVCPAVRALRLKVRAVLRDSHGVSRGCLAESG